MKSYWITRGNVSTLLLFPSNQRDWVPRKGTDMNYAKAIKTIRGTKGLSQKDLALLIGKTPGYISKIESGNRIPATEVIELICQKLNVPYYLFALLSSDKNDVKRLPAKETKIFAENLLDILIESESQQNAR